MQELLDSLFQNRHFVGVGVISKTSHSNGLSFSEGTLRRAISYLGILGKEIYWSGKLCKVYSRSEVEEVLRYINSTTIKERIHNMNVKFPEKAKKSKELRSIKSTNYRQKIRDHYTSTNILSNKYHLSKKSILKIGKLLNIDYVPKKGFYNKDLNSLESYLNNLPSDPKIRSRLLASITNKNLYGYSNYMQTSKGKKQISESRRNKCEELKRKLEKNLGLKLISSKEAQEIVNRNNSTVISTAKSLNIKIYVVNGLFYYDKNDIIMMDNFFKAKAGNKGQLARLFESELNMRQLDYITEKTFPDLRVENPLRFDYYLTKYNCLVEIQGGQHFHPYAFNINITKEEALNNFKELQKRDQMKKDYCRYNNINLIEVTSIDDFKNVWDYIKGAQ